MNKYDKGFISLYRQFKNWRYYKNDNIKSVFIHCLLSAYWKDEVITEYRGKTIDPPITIPKGSFITSRRAFAKDLEKTEGEIREAWSKLSTPDLQPTVTTNSTTQEITLTTTQLYTIVTINKFEEFQVILKDLQPTVLEDCNPQNHPPLQPQLNNIYLNKDKKIKRYKDISAAAHSENLNSLTLKLLKNDFIDNDDVPEMYNQLFDEFCREYDLQHINVVLDYILNKVKNKNIKNKYFYLKRSLEINLKKMNELMKEENVSENNEHEETVTMTEDESKAIIQEFLLAQKRGKVDELL